MRIISTSNQPTTSIALENVLMKQANINWSEASKIVKKARTELGLRKNEPWTEELRVYCEKVLTIDNKVNNKNNNNNNNNNNMMKVNNPIDMDETSNSESDDGCGVHPAAVAIKEMKMTITDNKSILSKSSSKQSSSERSSSLFKWGSSRKVTTTSQQQEKDDNNNDNIDTLSNFFGQNITNKACNTPSIEFNIEKKKNHNSNNKKSNNSATKKDKKSSASNNYNNTTDDDNNNTRVYHLNDPGCRLTPLEALMLRRFDNLKYEDAACLVADARTNLNVSKWEAWTDELYIECEKLYEITYGPLDDDNNTYSEWEKNSHSSSISSNISDINDNSYVGSIDIDDDDDDEEYNVTANTLSGLRKPQEDDYASVTDDGESIGYQSSSGWSSIWDNDDNDDFSVATHDKEDQYSVKVIKKLKERAERDEEEIASIRSRVTTTTTKSKRSSSAGGEEKEESTVGSISHISSKSTKKSNKKSNNNTKSKNITTTNGKSSEKKGIQNNDKESKKKSNTTKEKSTTNNEKKVVEKTIVIPVQIIQQQPSKNKKENDDEKLVVVTKTKKRGVITRVFGCFFGVKQ